MLRKLVLVSVPLIGLLIAACAPSTTAPAGTAAASAGQTAAPKIAGGTISIRLGGDWGTPIDGGHTVVGNFGIGLASAMYDRLVYYDPTPAAKDQLVPYVAASWTQTPTSITFKLRDDVTCADGTKVTPTVVYNSMARYIAPETKSKWVAFGLGPGPFTMSKDDAASTFTITTAKPFPNMIYGLSNPTTGIICPKGLEPGADFTKSSYGSGPFVFKSAVQGSEYVMTKRDGWNWGPKNTKSSDSGFPDTLLFKAISNDTTASNLLVSHDLDLAPISGPDVKRLAADATLEHKVTAAGAPYILALSQSPERVTSSITVRKAIVTALDPRAWTQAAGEPDAPVSTNIHTNPGGYCYTDLSALIPKPSVDEAKKILASDGYTPGPDGKLQKVGRVLQIKVLGSSFTGSGVEYIADTLNQVGFKVDLLNTDYNTFAQNYLSANYDVTIGLHGGNPGDPPRTPLFLVGQPADKGGSNVLGFNDPKLQDLVNKGIGATTLADACQAWKDFETYALQNYVTMPWASGVTHWFAVKGAFAFTPYGNLADIPSLRRAK